MSDRRSDFDNGRAKRQKVESNPYMAHMNADNGYDDDESYGGGQSGGQSGPSDGLTHFKRHATTCAQASKAEDGPANPFSGKPLSEKYFRILKTRRGLPVHSQRYVTRNIQDWSKN